MEWEAKIDMLQCSALSILQHPNGYNCPGDARVKGNDSADRLAGKENITIGLGQGKSVKELLTIRINTPLVAWRTERGVNRAEETLDYPLRKGERKGHRQSVQHRNCFKDSTRACDFPSA